jgi:hypothetical protein
METYAWFSTALFTVACLAFINGIKNPFGAVGWGLATVFPLMMYVRVHSLVQDLPSNNHTRYFSHAACLLLAGDGH